MQGRSWFSLYHLPELPQLPTGGAAMALIAGKAANAEPLALSLLIGPRGLWLAAIPLWFWRCRPERPLAAAALAALRPRRSASCERGRESIPVDALRSRRALALVIGSRCARAPRGRR